MQPGSVSTAGEPRRAAAAFASPPRCEQPPPLPAPRTPDADARWRRGFGAGNSRGVSRAAEQTGCSPQRRAAAPAAYAVDVALVSPAFQALLPALSDVCHSEQLVGSCCQRLGVDAADVALFELVPVPPGALPPPGARVAVALRSSTLSLQAVEALIEARDDAQRDRDNATRQLEAARAELLRERAARLHAQARATRRLRSKAACDALRFLPAVPPPAAQLAQLGLQEVAVGGAALVGLAGIAQPPPPRVADNASALRMHAGAALAERADCAPASSPAPRFARV